MKFIIKAHADGWVTINGVHVLIDGKGKITKGPAKFIGSTLNDLPNSAKSTSSFKKELKEKANSRNKSSSSQPSKKETKESPHRVVNVQEPSSYDFGKSMSTAQKNLNKGMPKDYVASFGVGFSGYHIGTKDNKISAQMMKSGSFSSREYKVIVKDNKGGFITAPVTFSEAKDGANWIKNNVKLNKDGSVTLKK